MHNITNNMSFADLESELRNKADECHNNNGSRTWEDWERMNSFLLAVADRIKEFRVNELPVIRKAKSDMVTCKNTVDAEAEMRETLNAIVRLEKICDRDIEMTSGFGGDVAASYFADAVGMARECLELVGDNDKKGAGQ